jgi:hypothetical protein
MKMPPNKVPHAAIAGVDIDKNSFHIVQRGTLKQDDLKSKYSSQRECLNPIWVEDGGAGGNQGCGGQKTIFVLVTPQRLG